MIGKVLLGEDEAKKWFNGSMNLKETAEYLDVSKYTLRKWVKEDKIPYTRLQNNHLLFHKTILDAWKEGKFQNGQIKLILDPAIIDSDHEEALRDHFKRYPELVEKKKKEDLVSKPIAQSNIKYKITREGVYLTVGSHNNVEVTICLSNITIEELYNDLNNFRRNRM